MDNTYSVGVRYYYYGVMAVVWDLPAQLAAKQNCGTATQKSGNFGPLTVQLQVLQLESD